MTICRLCIKCKEYIFLDETYQGQLKRDAFEKDHDKHPLITVNYEEVKDFQDVNSKYAPILMR
ncbi:MAG: hypothetical protein ACTSU2_09900 [Promethearchaeota archaeon]